MVKASDRVIAKTAQSSTMSLFWGRTVTVLGGLFLLMCSGLRNIYTHNPLHPIPTEEDVTFTVLKIFFFDVDRF